MPNRFSFTFLLLQKIRVPLPWKISYNPQSIHRKYNNLKPENNTWKFRPTRKILPLDISVLWKTQLFPLQFSCLFSTCTPPCALEKLASLLSCMSPCTSLHWDSASLQKLVSSLSKISVPEFFLLKISLLHTFFLLFSFESHSHLRKSLSQGFNASSSSPLGSFYNFLLV